MLLPEIFIQKVKAVRLDLAGEVKDHVRHFYTLMPHIETAKTSRFK